MDMLHLTSNCELTQLKTKNVLEFFHTKLLASSAQESDVQGCGVSVEVSECHCSQLSFQPLHSCCLCLRLSASPVSLIGPTTSFQSPNHDRSVELRCHRTISMEQSSCCSVETRDVTAYFSVTTEVLSLPHLMCRQTQGTFTARCCCHVSRDSDTGYKTADLLTYSVVFGHVLGMGN